MKTFYSKQIPNMCKKPEYYLLKPFLEVILILLTSRIIRWHIITLVVRIFSKRLST